MRAVSSIFFTILYFFFTTGVSGSDQTWAEVQKRKKGELTIYYRSTEPFLITEADGTLRGLEYEMMVGFKYFLWNKYGIRINLNWQSKESFKYVFGLIKNNPNEGEFGLDIISRTLKREEEVGFSTPYFPDIQVLVSDKTIPTIKSIQEFKESFEQYTAVSVAETTYDLYLRNLRAKYKVDFNIIYKQTSNEIVPGILEQPGRFGYMDLPNYLIALNQNLAIKRQPILPIKGIGFSVIFKKGSDWAEPINEYLASPEYQILRNKGIQKYLGNDVYDLIESISQGENEEMVLLLKEKELVDKELMERSKQIQEQEYITNMLIACVIIVFLIAYALYNRSKIKSKANKILTAHRLMIENQNELLSKRNNELLELDEEKNNFISILSHDLRAPINNITALAGLLAMDDNLTESQVGSINHVAAESRRLNKMVTRILDVERIESKSTEDFRVIDLTEVIERVVSNYKQQALDKKITLHLDAEGVHNVMGLEQYLFHVFENLLSNAIKFSPLGEAIWIRVIEKDGCHLINFTDGGPGMSEEDQQLMFKKFQRLSAKPTAGERSTGLGLSIVAKYTELLDGKLTWESAPNEGTTFTVALKAV
ncbi:Signal transduction histidine kinase [Reichenbachiella faecimaris]|uniref:histidine kinase n=1 Tax=Reichenbachiella faecimaris TaxID=692418 RepID=A0A1W2GKV4_REIFA|nr:ATP-binding protein [Reichenbachiella faecimaris]SMD37280.1 Signal transduction histidine kinase [Reichenbachiella faecimaris]